MNFIEYHDLIQDGDTVIIYIGFNNLKAISIKSGEVLQTKYGGIHHKDLLGVKYGSKVQCSKGWIHVLYPTPKLWTQLLQHRTQILYFADISLILYKLDIRPGSVVIESGTGSGSLSHAFIRSIMPTGHLHTFEFHCERAQKVGEEFSNHGLNAYVTLSCRDVCTDGFSLQDCADAVFLDLPQPWEAIDSAFQALKPTAGRFCSFSPCIEQVQKTCAKLRSLRFTEIETCECLLRTLEVRDISMPVAELKSTRKPYSSNDKLRPAKMCKVEGDINQCENDGVTGEYPSAPGELNSEKIPTKGTQDFSSNSESMPTKLTQNVLQSSEPRPTKRTQSFPLYSESKPTKQTQDFSCSIAPNQSQGHTGYLTFATLLNKYDLDVS